MTAQPAAPAPLRLATRRSALALAQSRTVGEQLAALTGRRLELVEVTTRGDVDQAPLTQIGGTGVFVVAVRQALVDGRADVAVHSLKDLPTTPDERLHLAAIPAREDPRDALVARDGATLATLPLGARVGTGSPRRRAQIAAARPDLDIVDIRGNVDTRIARVTGDLDAGGLDAVVLAAAGLSRLDRQASVTELIDPERVMPAPGQGALAVEVRAAAVPGSAGTDRTDPGAAQALTDALRSLDDPHTRAAVVAERALLAALEAGCSAPVGALAAGRGRPGSHGSPACSPGPPGRLARAHVRKRPGRSGRARRTATCRRDARRRGTSPAPTGPPAPHATAPPQAAVPPQPLARTRPAVRQQPNEGAGE